ncbi:MAG TPA: phosphopantothenoylcysteine decarboxylase [Planctomycetota bacterium]|nr:phosphopantothenoylcysteine decarboxylase [Planctomycetota bacterium]
MHVLVTAGPTREYLDDVRYISSPSTGRMGFAAAEVFAAAGHVVDLITGPTHLEPPAGVRCVRVTSALDMHRAVMERLAETDAVVMTAAVGDYRPREHRTGKRKRTGEEWLLELVENPDILKEIGTRKGDRVLVGFAVESDSPRRGALDKLRRKNLDLIVLNSPSAFGADVTSVDIIDRSERTSELRGVTKHEVARVLLERIEALHHERNVAGET